VSDFLTQQQQRRRFTRVAVVESEESRGAFSFSNTKEKNLFLNRRVKFQGITNTQSSTLLLHAALFITIHTTIVMLLLYYY
jgi:hypothetical protein